MSQYISPAVSGVKFLTDWQVIGDDINCWGSCPGDFERDNSEHRALESRRRLQMHQGAGCDTWEHRSEDKGVGSLFLHMQVTFWGTRQG